VSAAQEAGKPTEPEYNRIAFYLDGQGSLVPLERQQINAQVKVKALGFGGAKSSARFEGARSPVRFKADDRIQFVIRLETQGEDPTTLINLDVLTPTKSTREVVTAKAGPMGIHGESTKGASTLSINCAKYGEHSIRLVPGAKLPPGEYVITTKGSREGFLFGID
jgi:hypothetical protein